MLDNSRSERLKIDVVVHGRLHAFHLARGLLAEGHDVRLLTNYPKTVVRQFGIPADCVVSFLPHGLAVRAHNRLFGPFGTQIGSPSLHKIFGAWAAGRVRADADLIYIFSSVAEETIRKFAARERPKVWMVRGSSHIRTQHQLLSEEEARVGTKIEKPSEWAVQREEREYALASRIVTLSTFARDSFINQSVPEQKVILLLSAVDTARFKPTEQASLDRYRRIRDGAPLRILTTGAFSYRKGARDLADVASALCGRMQFRFVGDTPSETARLRKSIAKNIEFYPRVPESMLKEFYAWGDVFMFPTIEDGFPAVVAQALASGLPVLTTPNSSGPDLILEGRTGWVVPIRHPALLADRLLWCDAHRGDLAEMSLRLSDYLEVRDWRQMARDLVRQYAEAVAVPIRA